MLETPWDFRNRTAKRLCSLFKVNGIKPLWAKVLDVLVNETWEETHDFGGLGNPAAELRQARSRRWFEGVSAEPAAKRIRGATKHRRSGPVVMWEDPLRLGVGEDWRQVLKSCTCRREWKRRAAPGMRKLARRWSLPMTALQVPQTISLVQGTKRKAEEKEDKILHLLTEDRQPKGEVSFKLLCDSSTVVDAINGDLPMDTEFLKPAFYRISRHLEEWSNGGIAFSGERLQPAEWRPRELNKVADALANEAMDRGESFERWHVNQKGLRGRHILVFTDGGVRPSRARRRRRRRRRRLGRWLLCKTGSRSW